MPYSISAFLRNTLHKYHFTVEFATALDVALDMAVPLEMQYCLRE